METPEVVQTVINCNTELSMSPKKTAKEMIEWLQAIPEDATISVDYNNKMVASWTITQGYHPGPDKEWKFALQFDCPTCESPINEFCVNLNKRIIEKYGAVAVKNPHAARRALAVAEFGDF